MIFCSECFKDNQIKSIIVSLNHKGSCPICKKDNTYIYDTNRDVFLNNFLDELILTYTPKSQLPATYPASDVHMLIDELKNEWNLFNDNLESKDTYNIVKYISLDLYNSNPEYFDSPLGVPEKYDLNILKEFAILSGMQWNDFVECIKYDNRFHTQIINTEKLKTYLNYLRKDYKKGKSFFRGRVCNSTVPFTKNEMGAPPKDVAKEGRANSSGISRLYLADSSDTCIYEIRAGAFDMLSIGTFKLCQDISVVDFKQINTFSPFNADVNFLEYLINKPTLKKIDAEMGRAVRASDNRLDYIPTQYLCDFIKTLEFETGKKYGGVEYSSTLNSMGYNLAVFHPDIFKCTKVNQIKINNLKYDYK